MTVHMEKERARFERFTRRDEKSGCLLWTGGKDRAGYGRMWIGNTIDGTLKKEKAHRVAWLLKYRVIPKDKPWILHRCDNPACCEITHLWAGNSADNNRDRSVKGRSRRSRRGMPRNVQPSNGRFQARLQIRSTQIYLGQFATPALAERAARKAERVFRETGIVLSRKALK